MYSTQEADYKIIPNILRGYKNKFKNTIDGKSNFQNINFYPFLLYLLLNLKSEPSKDSKKKKI